MKIRAELIIRYIETKYGIPHNIFLSNTHQRKVARPRQIAMYLVRKMTGLSLPAIAMRHGGLHHTTVLHAVRKVEALMKDDDSFKDEVMGAMQDLTTIAMSDWPPDVEWPGRKNIDAKIFEAVKEYLDRIVEHERAEAVAAATPARMPPFKKITHKYLTGAV